MSVDPRGAAALLAQLPELSRAKRTRDALTLRQAAAQMGTTASVVNDFERGIRDLRLTTAAKVLLWLAEDERPTPPPDVLDGLTPSARRLHDLIGTAAPGCWLRPEFSRRMLLMPDATELRYVATFDLATVQEVVPKFFHLGIVQRCPPYVGRHARDRTNIGWPILPNWPVRPN